MEGKVALVVASIAEEEAFRGEALLGPLAFLVHKTEDFCLVPIDSVLPVIIQLHIHLCLGGSLC